MVLMLSAMPFENHNLLPIDAVLVLDVSNSMRTADPNRISRDAMNLFIKSLTEGQDRVGIVSYAGQVEESLAMTTINEETDIEFLSDFINGLNYAAWTDHGLGLLEAIRLMHDGHEEQQGRQPVIIFLTDGNLAINPSQARTIQEAEDDILLALYLANKSSIPIYTIGLNFDGSLDRNAINRIAEETGGISFETKIADDLTEIMGAIFAVMQTEPQITVQIPAAQPTPTPTPTPTPAVYIPTETLTEPLTHYPSVDEPTRLWLFLSVLGIVTALLVWSKIKGPKRVFTGHMVLEVISDFQSEPPLYRNLIEYGKHTTLNKLIGRCLSPALDAVAIVPSPTAPSHLPQLFIKCKHPLIKFTKDFMEQNATAGLSLNPGTEMIVLLENENKQIRLRYVE